MVAALPPSAELREFGSARGLPKLLSPPQRLCVKLFYLEGWSYKEIAALTGMDVGAVRSNIPNGCLHLREAMERGEQ